MEHGIWEPPSAGLDFGRLDLASPVDNPPVFIKALTFPCPICEQGIKGTGYTFFASTVWIAGTCVKCGPKMAIFVPDIQLVRSEIGTGTCE